METQRGALLFVAINLMCSCRAAETASHPAVARAATDASVTSPCSAASSNCASQDACLTYGPMVQLTGVLARQTFAGRPNYESTAEGDEAETGFYLRLAAPVCTQGDDTTPDAYPQNNVTLVQLVLVPEQYEALRPYLNKRITVAGSLFAAFTAHHHAPLLIKMSVFTP